MKRIYLDYASSTPAHPRVAKAVSNALKKSVGNPSSGHEEGRQARELIDDARQEIARTLSVKADELVFTSGGTESNALAILGVIRALMKLGLKPKELHVVTSTIEHSSILETMNLLEEWGVAVTRVSPNALGIIEADTVRKAVRPETALVTLAHVNSETGVIQPLKDISRSLASMRGMRERALVKVAPQSSWPVLHADAAQSPLYLEAGPHTLGADLVSYDAQKVMGPKGVGILYRDFSVPILPLYGGGTQEREVRPGTENVPGIVGAGVAFQIAHEERAATSKKVASLRDTLISLVRKLVPDAELIGTVKKRSPNNALFAIPDVDGDYLSILMDEKGIAVSPRSACLGSKEMMSYVVYEITGSKELARGTIRFTLGPTTTKADVARAVRVLREVVGLAKRPR